MTTLVVFLRMSMHRNFVRSVFTGLILAISIWRIAAAVPAETYPLGTAFVAHHGGNVVFATGSYYKMLGTKEVVGRFPVWHPDKRRPKLAIIEGPPQSITFSPDNSRLIYRYFNMSYVLRTSNLHTIRTLDTPYAWWDGNHVMSLNFSPTLHLQLDGHRYAIRLGKTDLVAADDAGRYFLGIRQVESATEANSETPTFRMELWERFAHRRFKRVYNLTRLPFDPAEGDPCHVAVLKGDIVVFGEPAGGAAWFDFVCAFRKGHGVSPLTDDQGNSVVFFTQPIVTKDAIVGLATTFPDQATGKYLYRITERGISIHPVANNAVLVTYDPKRGVGLGIEDKTGVTIRYNR